MKKRKRKKAVVPESIEEYIESRSKRSPEFKKTYMTEITRLNIAYKVVQLRKARHLSQAKLAKKMHTSQQMISRLEDSKNTELTITTLSKLAVALKARLAVDFVPQDLKIA